MRLTPDQQARLSGRVDPAPKKQPKGMLTHALALAADGWAVFPLKPGSKIPLLPRAHEKGIKCNGECGRDGHGAWDGTSDPATIRRWWSRNPTAGIGANLGVDRIAFDIDVQHGGALLQSFPATRVHDSGRGNGNQHLIYRVDPGTLAAAVRSGTNVLGPGMDIRSGQGSYIVMPPTLHEETGRPYAISGANDGLEHTLTDGEVQAIWDEAGVEFTAKTRAAAKGLSVVEGGTAKKKAPKRAGNGVRMLSDLLADPPVRGHGETNDWLARVAGHYAKQYRDKRDLYEAHVYAAANMVQGEPYPEDEVNKTLESIWETETAGHPERGATINNGYMVGNGRALFCQVQRREGEEITYDLAPYADFDLTARGVAVDDTGRRMFWVRLNWNGTQVDTTLDSRVLSDPRQLNAWLAQYGASIDTPFNAYPKTVAPVRLLRYLNDQDPSTVEISDTLGYHAAAGGFVTHDGVITPDGPVQKESAGVVADPGLLERKIAPFEYGFERDWGTAREVLAEILTFQEETVSSLFGAWWAACLLKPQIQERTSLFPFFGVEASSESGKTNGLFDLMVQLNGNTQGQIAPTRPVLRDYASANQSGIVWADDLDDLEPYQELLRASTSNGVLAKMDMDRSSVKGARIVAPILLTGETLSMDSQKALLDRSVVMSVNSPKDRRSLKGDYAQWDDIVDLKAQYPESKGGLAVLAGWYVQHALRYEASTIKALSEAKKMGSGRAGDKHAVLRAGARLLDALLGHDGAWEGTGDHAARVEAWISGENSQFLDRDNALTLKVIPWALRQWGYPDSPESGAEMGKYAGIITPVFMEEVEDRTLAGLEDRYAVYVQLSALSDAWVALKNGRVDPRLETPTALRQQLDAIGAPSKVRAIPGTRNKARYRRLPGVYSAAVVRRARA